MTEQPVTRRWDPLVKLTHWSIVAAVLANAVFTGEGSTWHVLLGYGLAAMLGLRLLWGLLGPAEARFAAFPPSPRRAIGHLRDIAAGRQREHRSHNPIGALMVYAIWGTLLTVIGTGVTMSALGNPLADGARAERAATSASTETHEAREDGDRAEASGLEGEEEGNESAAREIHEAAVNLLYALILLHVAGVIFETRRTRRNLVLAMLPSRH